MDKENFNGKRKLMSIGDLKRKSKADMKNHYGFAILAMILLNLVMVGSVSVGFVFGVLFTAGAVACCKKALYIDIAMHRFKGVDSIYRGFRQFLRALVANVFIFLIYAAIFIVIGIIMLIVMSANESAGKVVLPLCAILALIAIIIVSIRLSFVFYIMNNEIDLSASGCIKRSWQLSKGQFWKILGLKLSFIGWYILVLFTLGALLMYVAPYMATAEANLYLNLTGSDSVPSTEEMAKNA